MAKIIPIFFLLLICACVSKKKYNLLQQAYDLQEVGYDSLFKEDRRKSYSLAMNYEYERYKKHTSVYLSYQPLNKEPQCPAPTLPIKYHTIQTYKDKQEFTLGFGINDDFTIFPNRVLSQKIDILKGYEEQFSKICLLAYTSCYNDQFLSHYDSSSLSNHRTYYRFIHEFDTFWVGVCQWTVDSIKQNIARRSEDKKLAVYGARHKYAYDVYLQCTDCVSAFKNEKGECLCSR